MIKLITVVGTRPEIIRLSSTIKALNNNEAIDHILVHTGQNYDYELNEVFFADLGLESPNEFLNVSGTTSAERVGEIIAKTNRVFERESPDALLILGDTDSCLSAISAKKLHIPIFHMEAGNRCFDFRVPEESNRRIVDHLADINLPYSTIARNYLISEGIAPDRIIKTGSPMKEVLDSVMDRIVKSDVLNRLGIVKDEFIICSIHRAENVDDLSSLKGIFDGIRSIHEKSGKPIILSTHPRTRARLEKAGLDNYDWINYLSPLGFIDYNCLQINAHLVVSDSGTISEETSILGLRSLNVRQAHERPEAMEEGVVLMTGTSKDEITRAYDAIYNKPKLRRNVIDYNVDNVSSKVVNIILSYTPYINRVTYFK